MITIADKLNHLHKLMHHHHIDLYLVPSTDAHCNEYVPECWQRRPWISEFTGSAGEVLVTKNQAYLWTDGRYYVQAEQQLDNKYYQLMRQSGFTTEVNPWLVANAINQTIGVDPHTISISRARQLLTLSPHLQVKFIENNLIDECRIHFDEKLTLPQAPLFVLAEQYTGSTITTKLNNVRNTLKNHDANYMIISVLDEIAWLFNLRGNDIAFNPLFISYAVIGLTNAILFVDNIKLPPEVLKVLHTNNIDVQNYVQFADYIKNIGNTILLDDKTASYAIHNMLTSNPLNKMIFARSPIILSKACKNAIEVQGATTAHIKDAVAVIKLLSWLTLNWRTTTIDELIATDQLLQFRKQNKLFLGNSFDTISGFGVNGAVIHYRSTVATNQIINDSSLYLLDSGGQYLDGTTDITRTVHLGKPTPAQKLHYTLVLQGHLDLGHAVFVGGTCGENLDILARQYLWDNGLDYRHGTGHGVGSVLCVHEGPQRISQAYSGIALQPGMIVSNEPGFYIPHQYGIRIENLCVVTKIDSQSEYGQFYTFNTLSLVPYCKSLIDFSLLSPTQISQINQYYARIRELVMPLLDTPNQNWLKGELDI